MCARNAEERKHDICEKPIFYENRIMIEKPSENEVFPDGELCMDHSDRRFSFHPYDQAISWLCHLLYRLRPSATSIAMDESASRSHSVSCDLSPVSGRTNSVAESEVTLSPN